MSEFTLGFILLLVITYAFGHVLGNISLAMLLDWLDSLDSKRRHKKYLTEIGLTESEYKEYCLEVERITSRLKYSLDL